MLLNLAPFTITLLLFIFASSHLEAISFATAFSIDNLPATITLFQPYSFNWHREPSDSDLLDFGAELFGDGVGTVASLDANSWIDVGTTSQGNFLLTATKPGDVSLFCWLEYGRPDNAVDRCPKNVIKVVQTPPPPPAPITTTTLNSATTTSTPDSTSPTPFTSPIEGTTSAIASNTGSSSTPIIPSSFSVTASGPIQNLVPDSSTYESPGGSVTTIRESYPVPPHHTHHSSSTDTNTSTIGASSHSRTAAMIGGIVGGVVVFMIIMITVLICLIKRWRRKRREVNIAAAIDPLPISPSRSHLMDPGTTSSTSSYSASMQMLINELGLRDSAQAQDIETQPGRHWSNDRKERTQSQDSSPHSPELQAHSATQISNLPPRHEEEHDEELNSDSDSMIIPPQPNETSDQQALDTRLEFMTQRIARLEAEQWAPPPGYSRE
ncbi:hypothetical protein PQX77_001664 [Marasmius sp. AFHP31]|nr:hypothetical protein PQX77_001664 [Marasmius sp. AFHP31]